LRIWPLYYILVLLVFLVFPYLQLLHYPGYDSNFLAQQLKAFALYLSFFPNLSNYAYGNVLYVGQTWSLGVEEFFYIFFPLGLYLVAHKNNLRYFLLLIIGSVTLTALSKLWCNASDTDLSMACIYISRYRIYAFALGAVAAYCYLGFQNNNMVLKYIKQLKVTGYVLFFIATIMVLSGVNFSYLTHPVFSILFALMLFVISVSGIKIAIINNPAIVYFGKISYGIYMLHPLAAIICIKLFYFNTGNDILTAIIFSLIVVTVTIILSIISYTFLEKPFLSLRKSSGKSIAVTA
ncbi:MAG: acyltransferase, partial [Panacibacter sp.]